MGDFTSFIWPFSTLLFVAIVISIRKLQDWNRNAVPSN